ncbi:cupin domain-containing protein [Cerasicoccus fimbriatus]|uniref:cupin domain-containing protein n=1 Tax=Cerasicoccus fimbriatus TaxID=3014554 RepID=UPI0022B39F15|nr:cupin domain-containing protein [Cerasicoccus sp. TK19100]
MTPENLLANLPTSLPAELMEDLVCANGVRIERIVSTGQCSAPGDWYDQAENEWVLLLAGAARLEIEENDSCRKLELHAGDHCFLPAHQRHRVDWTDPAQPTVWLAVWWPA